MEKEEKPKTSAQGKAPPDGKNSESPGPRETPTEKGGGTSSRKEEKRSSSARPVKDKKKKTSPETRGGAPSQPPS